MVATTNHDAGRAAGYEDVLLWLYLAWRGLSVPVYAASTWESRARFRRPRVAAAAWLLLTANTAWSTRRLLRDRRSRNTLVTGWVDTAATAVILGFFPHALEPGDADPWRGWHVSQAIIQAEATSFLFRRRAQSAVAVSALAAAYAAGQVLAPGATDWRRIAGTGAEIAFRCLWTGIFAAIVRNNVERFDDAHADAMRTAENAALERSRARQRRYLNGGVLRLLESIADAEHPRIAEFRLAANREAGRLRGLLMGADGVHAELAAVVEDAADHGIDLEVVFGDAAIALPPAAVEAIRAEVTAAAGESASGAVNHVVLFVDRAADTLVATLRGSGIRREVRVAV